MILSRLKSNFIAERERWFLWVPVLFGAGIGFYFSLFSEPPTWLLIVIFEVFLLTIYLMRKKTAALMIMSSFAIFLFGLLWIKAHTLYQIKKIDFPTSEETTYLKGTILKTDLNTKGKTRLWLDDVSDFKNPRKGIYKITVSDSKQSFEAGMCVEMAATINAPSQALIPNGFEFNRQAFYQGVSAIGYALSTVYPIDCEKTPSFFSRFKQQLNKIRKNIASLIIKTLPKDEGAVASALLVGQRDFIGDNLYKQYQNAGLAHFLSISGLHMGLIAAFAFIFIRFLMALIPVLTLKYPSKKWAALGAIALSLIYLLFSGLAVSAERAFIMTSVVFCGIILDREAISMRMIAFAALVILMIEPHILLTPGFQMSFAAATALVSFYETFSQKSYMKTKKYSAKFLFYFLGICLTTLIATLATLPFTLYHFGTFAPYTLFGNILAAPMICFIIMPFIFLSFLLYPFGLSIWPLKTAGFGISILNKITYCVSHLTFADLSFSAPPFWAVTIIILGGLWLMIWINRWRFIGLIPILIGFGCFVFSSSPQVLYSADGKNIGLRTEKNELTVFTSRKNNLLNQIWQGNIPVLKLEKTLKSTPEIGLYCEHDKCTYQNFFTFDLNGYILFNNQLQNPSQDLGGAVYFKFNTPYLTTIRQTIGLRPWNK